MRKKIRTPQFISWNSKRNLLSRCHQAQYISLFQSQSFSISSWRSTASRWVASCLSHRTVVRKVPYRFENRTGPMLMEPGAVLPGDRLCTIVKQRVLRSRSTCGNSRRTRAATTLTLEWSTNCWGGKSRLLDMEEVSNCGTTITYSVCMKGLLCSYRLYT